MTQAHSGEHGRRRFGEAGQSLVEFAFVLPVLMLIFFGILEFGVAQMDKIHLANAARDGVRAGAIHFENNPIPIPDADRVTQATAASQTSATGLAACPLQTPSVDTSNDATAPPNGPYLTVTLTCTYSPITPLGSLFALLGGTLHMSTTLTSASTRYVEP